MLYAWGVVSTGSSAQRSDAGGGPVAVPADGDSSSRVERYWRAGAAVAVAGLVAWAFWQRCAMLFADPYPLGVDGYYYAIQLRSLVETGGLYYPAAPVAFWLMAPLAWLSDPVTGAKLGAAAAGALLAIPIYVLGRRLSGDRAVGVLAAALAVGSAQSLYLSAEFVKNGVGLTLMATYLAVLMWALEAPSRRRLGAAGVAFVAVVLCHKLAAVLAVAWSLPVLWVYTRDRRQRAAVVGIGALGALGVLVAKRSLLTGAFRSKLDLTLPALDTPWAPPLRFGHEPAIAAVLAVIAAAVWAIARRWPAVGSTAPVTDRALITGPIAFALVAAIPWLDVADSQGLGFRLRVITFVPLALCAAWLAGHGTRWSSPAVRAAFLAGFAAGWIASRPVAAVEQGVVHAHPAMQLASRAVAGRVPSDAVIIVPSRHLMFMVTWYTRIPARLRPDPVPESRRWRLLTHGLIQSSKPLQRALRAARAEIQGLHPGGPEGLVLLSESTWQRILRELPQRDRERLTAWPTY